jgi:uncharacterized membrane protein
LSLGLIPARRFPVVDIGPLHVIVMDFDEQRFGTEVMPELRALRETGVIRLIDLLLVYCDDRGRMREFSLAALAPEEAGRYGDLLRPLLSAALPATEPVSRDQDGKLVLEAREMLELGCRIPPGKVGAFLLLEHAWNARLVEALARAGGGLLTERAVSLESFIRMGARAEAVINGRR